jgi:hypothetical protein
LPIRTVTRFAGAAASVVCRLPARSVQTDTHSGGAGTRSRPITAQIACGCFVSAPEAARDVRVGRHVERAQLIERRRHERPGPATVGSDDEHALARAPDPQPGIARRTRDIVHDDPVGGTRGERQRGHAQVGRERVRGQDRADLCFGGHQCHALDRLREPKVAWAVVGHEVYERSQTNCSST